MLYGRLDERRADTARRLQSVLHDETVGTPQALTERDAAAAMYTDRLAALRAAEHGLAFGRLDTDTGSGATSGGWACSTRSTSTSRCSWTGAPPRRSRSTPPPRPSPEGMRRRRHLRTRRREVVAVDDEVLDLSDPSAVAQHAAGWPARRR